MKGYWNNPEATSAAFFPEGWLRTGDAAYLDSDGYVYVHDRVKDMIVSGAGTSIRPRWRMLCLAIPRLPTWR